ncbi:MAG TPA: DoxX family protein [Woeseiaceae bacterium]|nr:DoxX family protein [Woeseiaceae bacterium]
MGFMKPFESHTYALVRIVTGFLFLWHGSQKLFGFPPSGNAGGTLPFHIHWIAGPIEFIGGALVMIGLLTRPAAFLCSGLMAVAYWMAHAPQGLWPVLNHGDLAIVFCFVFLYISAKGAGIWSVDGAGG